MRETVRGEADAVSNASVRFRRSLGQTCSWWIRMDCRCTAGSCVRRTSRWSASTAAGPGRHGRVEGEHPACWLLLYPLVPRSGLAEVSGACSFFGEGWRPVPFT